MTKISVIMPATCKEFAKYAAKDRPVKLRRAIDSLIAQTYTDWELIVISDDCKQTVDVAQSFNDDRIRVVNVVYDKHTRPGWPCASLRNEGLKKSVGVYICYLDSDDQIGSNHLKTVIEAIEQGGYDWIFFPDIKWNGQNYYVDHECKIKHTYCGTSNICHVNTPAIFWGEKTKYGFDDYFFIKLLETKFPNFAHTKAGEYVVMHIPTKYEL